PRWCAGLPTGSESCDGYSCAYLFRRVADRTYNASPPRRKRRHEPPQNRLRRNRATLAARFLWAVSVYWSSLKNKSQLKTICHESLITDCHADKGNHKSAQYREQLHQTTFADSRSAF